MDKKTESNEGEGPIVDLFQLDHSKYAADREDATEVPQEVVREGNSEVTDVTKQEEEKENEGASVATSEEESSTEAVEKQGEKDGESEEDASTTDDNSDDDTTSTDESTESTSSNVQELMQSMADNDVLLFDEDSEYEPTEEGLASLISETVEKRTKEAMTEMRSSLPEEASKLLDVLEKGGTIEDFNALSNQINFNDVDTSSERNQGYLVEDWMKLQGFDDIEIRERLDDLKSAGLLEKEAKMAKTKLAKNQEKAQADKMAEIEENRVIQEKQAKADAEAFKKNVTGRTDIAGFSLTPKKAQKLYEFITVPDKDGKTGFQKADSEENRMLYAMMAMDGFDKEKLSKQEASKQTIKLRKKLGNYQDKQTNPKGGNVRRKTTEESGTKIPWSFGG